MTTQTQTVLDLTTSDEDFKFAIDGELYTFRTISSLPPVEEAALQILMKREQHLSELLEKTPSKADERITKISGRLRDVRVELITMMTSAPEDVVRKLSFVKHLQILNALTQTPESLREALRTKQTGLDADLEEDEPAQADEAPAGDADDDLD